MTMLDRMRRHKGWLKWSLAIVILAFIVLYIPSFLKSDAAGSSDVVASVEGRDITVGRFRAAYQRQMQAYRAQFGGNGFACDMGAFEFQPLRQYLPLIRR